MKKSNSNASKPHSNASKNWLQGVKVPKKAHECPSFEQMRAQIIGDTPASVLNQLWSIGYKQHLLQILCAANSHALVWNEQEDLLILQFYFDQTTRKEEMKKLLACKSIDGLIERYRFLNLPVSASLQETLASLSDYQPA